MSLIRSVARGVGYPLVIVLGIATLPLAAPVAVALNYRGTADRLAEVPGVRRGGGLSSGLALAAYFLVAMGTVGLLTAATGADVPAADTGPAEVPETDTPAPTTTPAPPTATPSSPTPTQTATPTPTAPPTNTLTPTPSPSPSPAPTATPTPTSVDEYAEFKSKYRKDLHNTTRVPLRVRGMEVRDDVLWIAHNATTPRTNSSRMIDEWTGFVYAYVISSHDHKNQSISGKRPERLRYVEVNTSDIDEEPATFYVDNSDIWEYIEGNITWEEFSGLWPQSVRSQRINEKRSTLEIDRSQLNSTIAPED